MIWGAVKVKRLYPENDVFLEYGLELDQKYDPHDTIVLFYDIGVNRFIDEYGNAIHDIYRILTPRQVMLFKWYETDCVFPDVTGKYLVELVYPDDWYKEKILRS
jgi:hypothetical protein